MAKLRAVDGLLGPAVAEAVKRLDLDEVDMAAVRLARSYAADIDAAADHAEAMEKLGPKLLAVLESLGATPAARSKLRKGGQPSDGPSGLARLREARSA